MSNSTLDKFRGALVGALVGDCLGRVYEFAGCVKRVRLQKYYDGLEDPNSERNLKYSDDTIMTKGLAESIAEHHSVNPEDIARRFVNNFFADPKRGYGRNVKTVFNKLKDSNFAGDIFQPASEQFDGTGSWGNGGAMRVSSIPLFYCSDYDKMLAAAEESARITHTHKHGINGTKLQAIAVQKCFHLEANKPINTDEFIQDIINKMNKIETPDEGNPSYFKQLKKLQNLLKKDYVSDDDVREQLGVGLDESALFSVPTAIYCFLRAQKPIPGLETDNLFRRATSYCISLGGDTDTIASMAGALCGAYLGYESISKDLQKRCEGVEEMIKLADKLHSIVFPTQ